MQLGQPWERGNRSGVGASVADSGEVTSLSREKPADSYTASRHEAGKGRRPLDPQR